jgi:hypothetical protein
MKSNGWLWLSLIGTTNEYEELSPNTYVFPVDIEEEQLSPIFFSLRMLSISCMHHLSVSIYVCHVYSTDNLWYTNCKLILLIIIKRHVESLMLFSFSLQINEMKTNRNCFRKMWLRKVIFFYVVIKLIIAEKSVLSYKSDWPLYYHFQ